MPKLQLGEGGFEMLALYARGMASKMPPNYRQHVGKKSTQPLIGSEVLKCGTRPVAEWTRTVCS